MPITCSDHRAVELPFGVQRDDLDLHERVEVRDDVTTKSYPAPRAPSERTPGTIPVTAEK